MFGNLEYLTGNVKITARLNSQDLGLLKKLKLSPQDLMQDPVKLNRVPESQLLQISKDQQKEFLFAERILASGDTFFGQTGM